MQEGGLLVFNGGSSSIKFTLYDVAAAALDKRVTGQIERIAQAPLLRMYSPQNKLLAEHQWPTAVRPQDTELLSVLMNELNAHMHLPLRGAGHRIVHGGPHYSQPTLLNEKVLAQLEASVPLAPLHLPHNLAPIRALAALYPQLPQIGCFDTGFHATMPRVERLFGLPRDLAEAGVIRYGFHGLSYEYIASQLPQLDARTAHGRTLVAHLGNGASVCALVDGKSVATSMGFSALDGLVMGTRCGSIDPGVLLYLLRERNYDEQKLEKLLYHECGLLGLSGGISSDMRDLLASEAVAAREAVEVFVHRLVREIGALAALAGGIDALVFTGGIGEHAAPIRAAVCAQLQWLGIDLMKSANESNARKLHNDNSGVGVWMIPTDEEIVIAQHCHRILSNA